MQARIDGLEQHSGDLNTNTNGTEIGNTHYNDSEVSVTASGILESEDENLMEKVNALIQALGEDVYSNTHITKVTRIPSKIPNRPGIVRISFRDPVEKVRVLRNKRQLKDTEQFKTVYIRSNKSRIERLIEMNARAVLRNLPDGRSLRVDASGRIKARIQNEPQQQPPQGDDTA